MAGFTGNYCLKREYASFLSVKPPDEDGDFTDRQKALQAEGMEFFLTSHAASLSLCVDDVWLELYDDQRYLSPCLLTCGGKAQ